MEQQSTAALYAKIEDLENRLRESEHLIDAIKAGEVDAFAIHSSDGSEIFTLQSGDYAYRVLIEEFGEGALNVTEDGLIVYTNPYFYHLVGLSYEKVIGLNIFDLIHPDFFEQFKMIFAQARKGKSKGEISLSVNGKTIPVYASLTSLQPKLDTVGIIFTDFTEKKKNEAMILGYQNDLESKNIELSQRNVELASFGYIASHDLQEPLRKIQLFSNRILEKESANFSPTSVDHFQRIISASDRMSKLINALLTYSKLDTEENKFIPTDLNILLEEVKVNLSEQIQDKQAIINNNYLPTLPVLPFQIVQLFTNIISNAIKYSYAGIKPIIEVKAILIKKEDVDLPAYLLNNEYWRIAISDNGIGFEPQYANQIFELFQRLHGKAEYEGTGVGLAICKKIVNNHQGYIRALGEPNKGSTFIIYLPLSR